MSHFSSISNVRNVHRSLCIVHCAYLKIDAWLLNNNGWYYCKRYIYIANYVLLCSKRSVLFSIFYLQIIYWQKGKRELNRLEMEIQSAYCKYQISLYVWIGECYFACVHRPFKVLQFIFPYPIQHSPFTVNNIQVNQSLLGKSKSEISFSTSSSFIAFSMCRQSECICVKKKEYSNENSLKSDFNHFLRHSIQFFFTFFGRFSFYRLLCYHRWQNGHMRMASHLQHGSDSIPSIQWISNEKNRISIGKSNW